MWTLSTDQSSLSSLLPPSEPYEFRTGLIIGHRVISKQTDYVVHLAPTPEEQVEGVDNKNEVDVQWILEHVQQTTRLLPGGIQVLGVFLSTPSSPDGTCLDSHASKLRTVLQKMSDDTSSGLVALHVESAQCRQLTSTADTTWSRVQVLTDQVLEWQVVESSFLLDSMAVLEDPEMLLHDKMEIVMDRLEKAVNNALVIIDGKSREPNQLLDANLKEEKGGKSKGANKKGRKAKIVEEEEEEDDEEEGNNTHSIELLLRDDLTHLLSKPSRSDNCCQSEEMQARLRLSGKMYLIGFLHKRATVAEAEDAIKQDLMRSLRGRMRMHCDSLVGTEVDGSREDQMPTLHEPPRRVLIRLPQSEACICDYLFPGETPEDATESVAEIFGFEAVPEAINDEIELVAGPNQSIDAEEEETSSARGSPDSLSLKEVSKDSSKFGPIGILIVTAVAVLAVVVAYFNISTNK